MNQYPYHPQSHQPRLHQQDSQLPVQGHPPYGYPPVDIHTPYPEFYQQPAPPVSQAGGGLFGGGRTGQMLGELQGFVNRMGGIDGILATVGKIQKLMSTVQQITPMLGLLLKKNPGPAVSSTASASSRKSGSRRRRRSAQGRTGRTSRSGGVYSSTRSRTRRR